MWEAGGGTIDPGVIGGGCTGGCLRGGGHGDRAGRGFASGCVFTMEGA